jgi:hypothetical protein
LLDSKRKAYYMIRFYFYFFLLQNDDDITEINISVVKLYKEKIIILFYYVASNII